MVEDEPVVRNFLSSALEELGYCVSAVGTAEEALQEADPEGDGPDLLPTDLRLPDQTGVWLHRALAEDRPGLPCSCRVTRSRSCAWIRRTRPPPDRVGEHPGEADHRLSALPR